MRTHCVGCDVCISKTHNDFLYFLKGKWYVRNSKCQQGARKGMNGYYCNECKSKLQPIDKHKEKEE